MTIRERVRVDQLTVAIEHLAQTTAALELAGELSAAPGAGGKPIHEWLGVRPFLAAAPTITE